MWSKSTNQLLSTHGFTLNHIILWDFQVHADTLSASATCQRETLQSVPVNPYTVTPSRRYYQGAQHQEGFSNIHFDRQPLRLPRRSDTVAPDISYFFSVDKVSSQEQVNDILFSYSYFLRHSSVPWALVRWPFQKDHYEGHSARVLYSTMSPNGDVSLYISKHDVLQGLWLLIIQIIPYFLRETICSRWSLLCLIVHCNRSRRWNSVPLVPVSFQKKSL